MSAATAHHHKRWHGHALLAWLPHAQRRRLLMGLLGLITAVEFFENAMFVFSSRPIMGGVDADPRGFALVQGAYAVGSMLMIIKQQWLARRYGYRRYLTAALALFMLGTLAAGSCNTLGQLQAARFVQGLSAGAFFTSGRVLVMVMFGPTERPRAARVYMVCLLGTGMVAPPLAALLLDGGNWRWVFWGALPPAALAMAGCWLLLPNARLARRPEEEEGWALAPLLWFGTGVVLLQWALSEARFDIFSHPLHLLILVLLGLVLLAAFLRHQHRHPKPLLVLRALGNPTYRMGLVFYFLYYLITTLISYLFPTFANQALAVPLDVTGWLSGLSGLVSVTGCLLYMRYGAKLPRKRPLVLTGIAVMAAVAFAFSRLPPDANLAALVPGMIGKGLFGVLVVVPIAGLTFKELAAEDFAHGYQSKNLLRQIAQSSASALGAVLLTNRQFAVHGALNDDLGRHVANTDAWVAQAQAALAAHGLDPAQALRAAYVLLAAQLDQQALLIACQDLYLLIAALALGMGVALVAQRRLK